MQHAILSAQRDLRKHHGLTQQRKTSAQYRLQHELFFTERDNHQFGQKTMWWSRSEFKRRRHVKGVGGSLSWKECMWKKSEKKTKKQNVNLSCYYIYTCFVFCQRNFSYTYGCTRPSLNRLGNLSLPYYYYILPYEWLWLFCKREYLVKHYLYALLWSTVMVMVPVVKCYGSSYINELSYQHTVKTTFWTVTYKNLVILYCL